MKPKINAVIIVEGENDKSYLSNLVDCEIYVTNGFDVENDNFIFLKELNQKVPLIILTDPDKGGLLIRKKLNELLTNPINIEVDILQCNRHGKHGVKECKKEEILKALSPYFSQSILNQGTITANDLITLGIDNNQTRDYISEKFHLGRCNNKQLLKRLNLLDIKKEQIKEVLTGFYGN